MLMRWLPYALLCAVFLASADFFLKLITQQGLLYSLAVGVAFSTVTILLYITFARVSVSLGSPTIRVMSILVASMLGILLLHEPFTWRYLFGLILTVAGVALIVFR
jgi:drug/metabolite transporter (DMT)-like permease